MINNFDVIVIGGGSAGLVAATTAIRLGKSVALIEKHKTGGECLHSGCVPSKALIHSAKIYHEMMHASDYGLPVNNTPLNFQSVMQKVRDVVSSMYEHEDTATFERMGISVLSGSPVFVTSQSLRLGNATYSFSKAIICTGSSPLILPIEGLDTVPYLTNENVWDLESLPPSMLIIGGGPISVEMAQSFSRFGTKVTIVEVFDRIIPNEDIDISKGLTDILSSEGIRCILSSKVIKVERKDTNVLVTVETPDGMEQIEVHSLFVSIGRKPNTDGLQLENAGVSFSKKGIEVNPSLQTTTPSIYACGDVVGPYRFTHTAGYQADIAIKNALFNTAVENDTKTLPWVIFSEPEAARVGLTEKEARDRFGTIEVLRVEADSIDRSKTERKTTGFLKVLLDSNNKIVGAHALAPHAGEFIHEAALAIKNNLGIESIGSLIHAYPTYSELLKKAATRYLRKHEKPATND